MIKLFLLLPILLTPPLIIGNRSESRSLETEAYVMMAEIIVKNNNKASLKSLKTVNEIYDLTERLYDAADCLDEVDLKSLHLRDRAIFKKRIEALRVQITAREDMILARIQEIRRAEGYKAANYALRKAREIIKENREIRVSEVMDIKIVESLMKELHEIEKYFSNVEIDEMSRNFSKRYEDEVRMIRLMASARRDVLIARFWELTSRAEIRKSA